MARHGEGGHEETRAERTRRREGRHGFEAEAEAFASAEARLPLQANTSVTAVEGQSRTEGAPARE